MEYTPQIALETIKNLSIEDFLHLLREKETLVVQVSNNEVVRIQTSRELPLLPQLDGYVPPGWKDAIYHE